MRMLTRSGLDWTARFRPIAEALAVPKIRAAYLDGEIAVMGEDGVTSLAALQDALSRGQAQRLTYHVFDLLKSRRSRPFGGCQDPAVPEFLRTSRRSQGADAFARWTGPLPDNAIIQWPPTKQWHDLTNEWMFAGKEALVFLGAACRAPKKEDTLVKLTDTQLVLLADAANRNEGSILPLPGTLKLDRETADGVFKDLTEEARGRAARHRTGRSGEKQGRSARDSGNHTSRPARDRR